MANTIMSSGRSDLTLARRYWKGVLLLPSYFAAVATLPPATEQEKKPR